MSTVILKNITQIIPHRCPMLMIDSYSRIDNNNALSEKKFQEGDYGCENGVVIDSILIECVAQTVAAHYGYQSLIKKDKNPGIGMLVSVDTFNFYCQVMETSKIDIFISKTDKIGAFKLFKGEIRLRNQIVATGNIKVFNPEEKDV
ncbi:MAG: hypothetical protein PF690_00080 [Deltaproteobacteria bacterium]|jgi:predicted hotdog family 3-hydroxylacyl-ACP dehydratase|nr:hypothetical protein [Deltaproteobacteria bacterium]